MTTTDERRRVLRNERRTGAVSAVDPDDVLTFHRSLTGYAPTALVASPELAVRLGVAEVWVKDESNRFGMPSFKILGASYATFRELCSRAGVDPARVDGLVGLRSIVEPLGLTLVAATDGNHGRAVARMAAYLGLAAHILVPEDMVPARITALENEGAQVTVVTGNYDDAVAQSARLQDERTVVVSDTSWEGYERVPGWVIDGYATIGAEVHAQLEVCGALPPTVVAAQIGVGAFAASVVRAFVPGGARVIGVEPTKADCVLQSVRAGRPIQIEGALDSIMAGLNCGSPSPVAWTDVLAGIDSFVAVDDSDAENAMRALARAGVVSGESGAAGLAGLLAFAEELELASDDRILVISTEGATDPAAYDRIVRGS